MITIERRAQAARQRMMEEARAMLARIKPFDAWAAELTESQRANFAREAGSIEAAYAQLLAPLKRQAAEPAPNVAIQKEKGVEFTWE